MGALNQLTVYCFDPKAQRHMLKLVQGMVYDEALTMPFYRLEYRLPLTGFPHYLLVRSGQPVALQYVRAPHWLNEVQIKLSYYLVLLGFKFENTWRNQRAATPLSFQHNRLPWMFQYEGWQTVSGEINEEEKEF